MLSLFKDILFPIYCLGCKREYKWVCDSCKEKIKPNYNIQKAVGHLNSLTAFFVYDEKEIIGKIIKLLKYSYVRELDEVIHSVIPAMPTGILFTKNISVIPVPLHPRRKRERGFNQAEILASIFNDKFKLGVVKNDILQRKRYTSQQAKLKKSDRVKNLQDAFVVNPKVSVPKCILLVDDVYTTGATMQESASVLKMAGAKYVWGMVLARG